MVEQRSSASSTAAPAAHGTAGKVHHEVVLPSEMADFQKNAIMTSRAKLLVPFQALHLSHIHIEVASPDCPSQHYSTTSGTYSRRYVTM